MPVEVLQVNAINGKCGNNNFGPIKHKYYNALAMREVSIIVKT